jgi:uncharacterized protein (TIGR03435 family)
MLRAALVLLALAAVSSSSLTAQSAAPKETPKFDIVSVKPCAPGERGQERGSGVPITSPGRLHLQCYPLSTLISEAYLFFANGQANPLWTIRVPVEGGPGWMKTDRFVIEAKGNVNAAPAMMRGPMLQALLEDRFKLKIRRESREVPIYELVVAKSGAKVTPYTGTDCVPKDHAAWPPVVLPAGQVYCGSKMERNGDRWIRTGVMTLDELVGLGGFDRPIVNRTGITSLVTIRLEYEGLGMISDEPIPPAMIAAYRDQLGLELRPSKGPREFLVIEHAERPAPNGLF